MQTAFAPLATNSYQANLYPSSAPVDSAGTPVLGVCLSGGGSRALSCALGQLSGLRSLPDPKNRSQTLLDRVDYLSTVSGGSWASVLFTYLPDKIGGKPVDDNGFLIFPQAPGALFKDNPSVKKRQNVSYMPPFCLGNVPAQFSADKIAALLTKMYAWGLFGTPEKRRWCRTSRLPTPRKFRCRRPPSAPASSDKVPTARSAAAAASNLSPSRPS